MTRIIEHLHDISDRYDALFVDLWGCVHNGIKAFPDAVAALRAYRERGGKVVLLHQLPAFARTGWVQHWPTLTCPKIVMTPSQPRAIPPVRPCFRALWEARSGSLGNRMTPLL